MTARKVWFITGAARGMGLYFAGAVLAAGTYFYIFLLPGKKGVGGMEPVG